MVSDALPALIPKFFRDAGFLALTELALRLKGLVLLPLLTRHFGTVNYGIWAQVAVVTALASPLLMAGLDSAAARMLPGRSMEEQRARFSAIVLYLCAVSVAAALALWAASVPLATAFFGSRENAVFVALAGGSLLTGLGTTACRMYFRVSGLARAYAFTNIAQSVLGTAVTVGVVVADGGVREVVLFTIITDAAVLVLLLGSIAKLGGLGRPDFGSLKPMLRFGAVLIPGAYAFGVITWTDRMFLLHMKGLDAVGMYAVAFSLGYLVIALVFNPVWVMYPTRAAELFNTGDMVGLSRLTRQSMNLALALVLPVVAGWFVLSEPILGIVAADDFVPGHRAVPLLALGYTILMTASYSDVAIGLKYQQRWSTVAVAAAMIANVVLNLLLIPEFGTTGAAIATASAFAVQFLIVAAVSARTQPVAADLRFLFRAALSAGITAPVVWVTPGEGLAGTVFRVGVGAGVYGMAMVALGAVSLSQLRTAASVLRLRTPAVSGPARRV